MEDHDSDERSVRPRGARADLWALMEQMPDADPVYLAALLGFEEDGDAVARRELQALARAVAAGRAFDVELDEEDSADIDVPQPPASPDGRSRPVPVMVPVGARFRDDRGEMLGDSESTTVETDVHDPSRHIAAFPRAPSLTAWSRLEPTLLRALAGETAGRRIDVPAAVERASRARPLGDLPRLNRRVWPNRIRLYADTAEHLVTLYDDMREVSARLRRTLGVAAVRRTVLDPATFRARRTRRGHLLGPGELTGMDAVLVMTDLGAGSADEASMQAWLETGHRVRRAGIEAVCLIPIGGGRLRESLLGRRLASVWRSVPWQPGLSVDLLPSDERTRRAERLLDLAAPARILQASLLRALRRLLPSDEADVETEIDAVLHSDVAARSALALSRSPGRTSSSTAGFHGTVARERRRDVAGLVREWHARLPAEVAHKETIVWTIATRGEPDAPPPPGDPAEAEAWLSRVRGRLYSGVGAGDWEAFRKPMERFVTALPPGACRDPQFGRLLGDLFAIATDGGRNAPAPDGVTAEQLRLGAAAAARARAVPRHRVALRQVAAGLRIEPARGRPDPFAEPLRPGSPLTTGEITDRVDIEVDGRLRPHPVAPGDTIPWASLRGATGVTLADRTIDLDTWTVPPRGTAPWHRLGRDEYGLYADLRIVGVPTRLRWIPPGRFTMGAPEEEPGSEFDRERPQHEVRIPRGFWLGETPVTQGLYEAVTGDNPSEFRTPGRPVEQVNWEQAAAFCEAVAAQVAVPGLPDLAWRLPTEAEWEYACRAGTTGATWRGDLDIRGDAHAPLLAQLGWYGGNANLDFELDQGRDGSWLRHKQHGEGSRGSHPVKRMPPNPWGLFDMLGNVWEWTASELRAYSVAPWTEDYGASASGSNLVSRGGSWYSTAWRVRAACRGERFPDVCFGSLGFRLAAGPALQPGGADSKQPGRAERAERGGEAEPPDRAQGDDGARGRR